MGALKECRLCPFVTGEDSCSRTHVPSPSFNRKRQTLSSLSSSSSQCDSRMQLPLTTVRTLKRLLHLGLAHSYFHFAKTACSFARVPLHEKTALPPDLTYDFFMRPIRTFDWFGRDFSCSRCGRSTHLACRGLFNFKIDTHGIKIMLTESESNLQSKQEICAESVLKWCGFQGVDFPN